MELCDAIAPALGLDDRGFLIRDVDFDFEKPGEVNVCMKPKGEV